MADEELNAYQLLDVDGEATEQQIRTAYRQRSLKVHPDRNPNNPDAAKKFHELNQAYELLLDPLRKLALDAKLRLKQARTERFKAYDTKRKVLVEELEERERAFKKAKVDKQKEELAQFHETEKIKDEGRRLREEREKKAVEREEEERKASAVSDSSDEPTLEPTDTTVRVKYQLSQHPTLTTADAISNLFRPFGAVDADNVVVLLKSSKKHSDRPPKYGSALIPFKKIGDAFAAVCASGKVDSGLKGIEVSWINGKEPQILGWLRRMGMLGAPTAIQPNVSGATSQPSGASESEFSNFPESFTILPPAPTKSAPVESSNVDFESLTLMRLRQAERERLEREIREQDANES